MVHRAPGRVGTPKALRQTLQQTKLFWGLSLEISEDILHQDHGKIHNDPQINGPNRQQVGTLASDHQQYDREEQRKGDVQTHDDGAAQIAQKNPLDKENQQAAEKQVVQYGMRR